MDDATRRIAARLAPLTNYERTRPDRPRFTLETMQALLDRLGRRRPAARLVQIGGSKGKGTTAAWLAALGRAAGLRTGLYASPHVVTILERIQVDGAPAPEADVDRALDRVLGAAAGLDPAPSFFEVMTAAALEVFAAADVELIALEVGLGGRLDATTAVDADASILTRVELEHTELLGDTVEAIAAEKAFVMRPGGLGFHAVEPPGAAVVAAHAERVGCRLEAFGVDFDVTPVDGDRERLEFRRGERRAVLRCGARPAHEDAAIGLAAAAFDALFPGVAWPERVPRPALPGRMEWRTDVDGVAVLLDGAHTRASAMAVAAALQQRVPGRPVDLLFGSAFGKRWSDTLEALLPHVGRVLVAPVTGTASEDPDAIVGWLRARGVAAQAVADADAGLVELRTGTAPRVITGSFYLVGAALDRFEPGTFASGRETLPPDHTG